MSIKAMAVSIRHMIIRARCTYRHTHTHTHSHTDRDRYRQTERDRHEQRIQSNLIQRQFNITGAPIMLWPIIDRPIIGAK